MFFKCSKTRKKVRH